MVMFVGLRVGEFLELAQEQRVFEDPLYRLDEVRLQRRRVLLFGVPGPQKLLEVLVTVCGGGGHRGEDTSQYGIGGEIFICIQTWSADQGLEC